MTTTEILSRLSNVKQISEHEWSARCPAHDDSNNSLCVGLGEAGKLLFKCFAGCTFKMIADALGLRNNNKRKRFDDYPPATPAALERFWTAKRLPGTPGFLTAADVRLAHLPQGPQLRFLGYSQPNSPPCGCIRAMVDGSLVRIKGGAEKYPNLGIAGLLGLPNMNGTAEVLLVEGLRDYLTARALHFAAVSGGAGAGTFKPEWAAHFRGRRVFILYDLDDAGREGARKAAAYLHGIAAEVRIVTLPGSTSGYDLSDFVADGHTADDIRRLMDQAEIFVPESNPEEPTTTSIDALSFHLTDAGNAELLESLHADKLKFDWDSNRWLYYDGCRWSKEQGEAMARRLALEAARHRLSLAAGIEDDNERKRYARHSFASESRSAVESCLSLARSLPGFAVHRDCFDQDVYAMNVLNGTVDLRTGKRRPHNPADMITMMAPVRFPETDEEARCDLWMDCLNTWHKGNQDTISYLQRLAGMCLTGDITSRKFPIFYGSGKNGKSVFLVDVLMAMLGDYACKAPRTLLKATVHDQHPTDVAGLAGKRLVVASETEQNMKLNIALVKEMTGDSVLTARFMRGDFFDFRPTHHTILMTQNLPVIDEAADAIWDRVHKVEWPVRIPANMQDTHLAEKLRAEWPGILKWCVDGCLEWLRDGDLLPTDDIRLQTEQYRAEQNPFHSFVEECCVCGDDMYTPVTALIEYFRSWARIEGLDREFSCIDAVTFSRLVTAAGYTKKNVRVPGEGVAKCWIGIGLQYAEVEDDIPI